MLHNKKHKLTPVVASILTLAMSIFTMLAFTSTASATAINVNQAQPGAGQYTCGAPPDDVKVSINFGCKGQGNATTDATFAGIRVLSAGVGLIVVGSFVVAGVQYTTSRGDPNATAKAVTRIRNSLYALLIYIFAAAMLNFVIPQGFFK
jgi:hypothetical protein